MLSYTAPSLIVGSNKFPAFTTVVYVQLYPHLPSHTHTHTQTCAYTYTHTNKQSLVDCYILFHEIQVIAFFLPEAPTEMFKIFDEVSFRSFTAF